MILFLCISLLAVCLVFLSYCWEINSLCRQLHAYNQGQRRAKLSNRGLFPGMGKLAGEINQGLRASEKLREDAACQEKRLWESIGSLGHDLRTPLTVLQGYSELLESNPEHQQEYLFAMRQKCAQLTETIDQFTQWHKAENPETPLHIERLDLAELLAVCLMEQAHLFCNAGVEPEVELPDQPIYIYSDKGACRRILENLLTNAHRHTTGQVYIKLDPPGESVHLVVANQAEGLKPEEVPLLFQRFYQYDSARSKGGSGLGVAIVKALTERLGAGLDAGVERGWFWVQIRL